MFSCEYYVEQGVMCGKEARLFMLTPKHMTKLWYCVEHYDRMAAYYKRMVQDSEGETIHDEWREGMVRVNGW